MKLKTIYQEFIMKPKHYYICIIFIVLGLMSCDKENDSWKEPPAPPEKVDVLTKIADPVFKNWILKNMSSFDIDKDGKLSEEEAGAVKNIYLNKTQIRSLEGIEYFIGIESLDCAYNELKSLDLSKNTKLTFLDCRFNQLEMLNIKRNLILTHIYCNNNSLKVLDVENKEELQYLQCGNNQIKSLDISSSINIEELFCYENQLTELHMNRHIKLTKLYAYGNKLTSLNVGKSEKLSELLLADNQIEELDISQCSYTSLRRLDAKNNSMLKKIWVTRLFDKGMMWKFDVPNEATITIKFHLGETSDITWSMSNTSLREYIEDAINKELAEYDKDESKGKLSTMEAATVLQLKMADKGLVGIDGIEFFTGLKYLDFSNNKIRSKRFVRLSNNKLLETLIFSNNSLPEVDITECKFLQHLDCSNNKLKYLDLSQNTELISLSCKQNLMTELDISKNQELEELLCSNNPQLEKIYVWKGFDRNKLTKFEIDQSVDVIERE